MAYCGQANRERDALHLCSIVYIIVLLRLVAIEHTIQYSIRTVGVVIYAGQKFMLIC